MRSLLFFISCKVEFIFWTFSLNPEIKPSSFDELKGGSSSLWGSTSTYMAPPPDSFLGINIILEIFGEVYLRLLVLPNDQSSFKKIIIIINFGIFLNTFNFLANFIRKSILSQNKLIRATEKLIRNE